MQTQDVSVLIGSVGLGNYKCGTMLITEIILIVLRTLHSC